MTLVINNNSNSYLIIFSSGFNSPEFDVTLSPGQNTYQIVSAGANGVTQMNDNEVYFIMTITGKYLYAFTLSNSGMINDTQITYANTVINNTYNDIIYVYEWAAESPLFGPYVTIQPNSSGPLPVHDGTYIISFQDFFNREPSSFVTAFTIENGILNGGMKASYSNNQNTATLNINPTTAVNWNIDCLTRGIW